MLGEQCACLNHKSGSKSFLYQDANIYICSFEKNIVHAFILFPVMVIRSLLSWTSKVWRKDATHSSSEAAHSGKRIAALIAKGNLMT